MKKLLGMAGAGLLLAASAGFGGLPAAHAVPLGAKGVDRAEEPEIAWDQLDTDLLMTDRAYAERFLRQLDSLPPERLEDRLVRTAVQSLRALALATLQRVSESGAAVDSVLASRPAGPEFYYFSWAAASNAGDADRMLAVVEAVHRNVSAERRPELFGAFDPEIIFNLYQWFRSQDAAEERYRLAEALVAMDWPGEGNREAQDSFRMIVLDRRLEQDDRAAAVALAEKIRTPGNFLTLILNRKYDGIADAGDDRLATLSRKLHDHDLFTRSAVEESPQDMRRVLERAQHLRSVGRDSEALALLAPFTANVGDTFRRGENGMWLVNEAAYALLALGRGDEAVSLMGRLVAQDISERMGLIGPMINHSVVLWRAGRNADALAYAERLERDFSQYANEYGKMWISSSIICSLAGLERPAEAAPWLERMQAGSDDNPAALMRAYLCLDRMDAAEALMIARLEGDEAAAAVRALQEYTLGDTADASDISYRRLISLRERPAVQAALERVGRIERLPLSRTYWGQY